MRGALAAARFHSAFRRIVWSPLADGLPVIDANAPAKLYPGNRDVDVVANDVCTSNGVYARDKNGALHRFVRMRRKPFALPEFASPLRPEVR